MFQIIPMLIIFVILILQDGMLMLILSMHLTSTPQMFNSIWCQIEIQQGCLVLKSNSETQMVSIKRRRKNQWSTLELPDKELWYQFLRSHKILLILKRIWHNVNQRTQLFVNSVTILELIQPRMLHLSYMQSKILVKNVLIFGRLIRLLQMIISTTSLHLLMSQVVTSFME